MSFHPTRHPEVNLVLQDLLPSVQAILGDHFIGMYLYGSLASGGFDRDSDVDYVVVTDDVLSGDLFSALDAMHLRLAAMDVWCATQLEGIYIPQAALRTYDPIHALHLRIDRGKGERLQRMQIEDVRLGRAWWASWVMLRHVLRERGVTLAGPAPRALIDPVPPDELRQAALAELHNWEAPLLDNPVQMENRGYQSYIVLTLCRILYTLQFGEIVSKQVAARWAQGTLDPRWSPLIDRAWDGRKNPGSKAASDDVNRTLEFIQCALERSQQLWNLKKVK